MRRTQARSRGPRAGARARRSPRRARRGAAEEERIVAIAVPIANARIIHSRCSAMRPWRASPTPRASAKTKSTANGPRHDERRRTSEWEERHHDECGDAGDPTRRGRGAPTARCHAGRRAREARRELREREGEVDRAEPDVQARHDGMIEEARVVAGRRRAGARPREQPRAARGRRRTHECRHRTNPTPCGVSRSHPHARCSAHTASAAGRYVRAATAILRSAVTSAAGSVAPRGGCEPGPPSQRTSASEARASTGSRCRARRDRVPLASR